MLLADLLVPTYKQMLRTLAGLLDKAREQLPEQADALLSARLAADMYPLSSQVRFAAFQACRATLELHGEAVPQWLEAVAAEARGAGDAPGSMSDARHRIDEALMFLDGVPADAFEAGAGSTITIELPGSVTFDMTGEQYARDWTLPQFYFHVVTAYAILRNQGVEIGKADYVPHMFAYLRPGSTPGR